MKEACSSVGLLKANYNNNYQLCVIVRKGLIISLRNGIINMSMKMLLEPTKIPQSLAILLVVIKESKTL